MGYTTEFTGAFRISRKDADPALAEFLSSCRDHAGNIPIFADWLEENGFPEAGEVRRAKTCEEVYRLFHGLKKEHHAYLTKFSDTERMQRDPSIAETLGDAERAAVGLPIGPEGAFFVGATGYKGQDEDASVVDASSPPTGQPGLWCDWAPNEDGTAIQWNGAEKFYYYLEWIQYLIDHFLGPWGYLLNGEVNWQGEEESDRGVITITDNLVTWGEVPWW